MDLSAQISEPQRDAQVAVELPPRMRMLFVTSYQRTGGWLAESVAADRRRETVLEEAVGAAAGVARLRDEVFDAVLVSDEPGEINALEVVEAIRAGGTEDPVIVLGRSEDADASVAFYDAGADAYQCISTTTPRALTWQVARAIERIQLLRENRRYVEIERQRLEQEHGEASRLLAQQRNLLGDLERTRCDTNEFVADASAEVTPSNSEAGSTSPTASAMPPELLEHYAELVRAYVVMGSGNLAEEMGAFARLLVEAKLTAHEAMLIHLDVVQGLVRGRGSRSAKHLVMRAELLILEIMVQLAEGYRERWQHEKQSARQIGLADFDLAPGAVLGGTTPVDSQPEAEAV